MELSPSPMVLDPDVSDPERGTTVGHEKKVGATNHVVEIVTMTITGKEAGRERGIVIVTEIVTESETERESIVTVKEGELFFHVLELYWLTKSNHSRFEMIYTIHICI